MHAFAIADHGAAMKPGGDERYDQSSDSGEHCGLRRFSARVLKDASQGSSIFRRASKGDAGRYPNVVSILVLRSIADALAPPPESSATAQVGGCLFRP
jgi:hypothetical protein